MKYNKTRLCIGGMAGFGSVISFIFAARLLDIIKYGDIEIGVLFAGPLMWSAVIAGVSFAILSAI